MSPQLKFVVGLTAVRRAPGEDRRRIVLFLFLVSCDHTRSLSTIQSEEARLHHCSSRRALLLAPHPDADIRQSGVQSLLRAGLRCNNYRISSGALRMVPRLAP